MDYSEMVVARKNSVSHIVMDVNRLPAITGGSNSTSNRRSVIHRSNTFCGRHSARVPQPGQEYDFRRTPDVQTSSRRYSHGHARPHIPEETQGYETIRSHVPMTYMSHDRYALNSIHDMAQEPTLEVTFRDITERPEVTRRCSMPLQLDGNVNQQRTANLFWDNYGNTVSNLRSDHIRVPDAVPDSMPEIVTSRRNSVNGNHNEACNNDVIISDSEQNLGVLTPTTDSPLDLTESVIRYFFQRQVDKNQRISKWLADCEELTCMTSLPSHLPDISVQRRNVAVSP